MSQAVPQSTPFAPCTSWEGESNFSSAVLLEMRLGKVVRRNKLACAAGPKHDATADHERSEAIAALPVWGNRPYGGL